LYAYDEVGNIASLTHIAAAGSYTRTYQYASGHNKLLSTKIGANTYNYAYDAHGNQITFPHLQQVQWNALDQLSHFSNGPQQVHYQYSGGQRIVKTVTNGNVKEQRIYLGSFEIYRKFVSSSLICAKTEILISCFCHPALRQAGVQDKQYT
jgi:hypothetical protein